MEQFRQVGEVLGGLKALMVLKHEISINQRQCHLLFDILTLAFDTISEEIQHNLKLPTTKWKAVELPMKELHRVFKEADLYIRQCIDIKDWWGKAITLHMNRDCVESHIHNLFYCFPAVIEAIETSAEISGVDQDDIQRRRISIMQKYDPDCDDLKYFLWKFGRQYLVSREILNRMEMAWNEDRWLLLEKIKEKKTQLGEVLNRKLNLNDNTKLFPSGVLVKTGDYFVRRRLGGSHLKEIHWLGESLAMRTFYGDVNPTMQSDISLVLSLSHPNVLQYLCAFYDEERKEGFLVMELMSKDLGSHIKEHTGQKNRTPITIPVAVDIMLQIARGMEYLHSKKIYLGDLNPSNILLKPKNASVGGFQVKVTGFGMNSIKISSTRNTSKPTAPADLNIWLAPEVLAELDQPNRNQIVKNTEKADVYSFGMLCFELLTGKVPFEDSHLQGEKMVRNILAGERPLFSHPFPKYLQNLTRKCWQTNPEQRPAFSSLCRILRYVKKNLIINPNNIDPESPPLLVDYCDMEAGYLKRFPLEKGVVLPVSQIPFQMFTYTIFEKQKVCGKKSDAVSMFGDENLGAMDDHFLITSERRSFCSEIIDTGNSVIGVDMRSVISETPNGKLRQLDQPPLVSEKKNKTDQKSPITDHNLTIQKVKLEEKAAEASPITQAAEQKLDKSQSLDVKHSRSMVEHRKKSSSQASMGKSLMRALSFKRQTSSSQPSVGKSLMRALSFSRLPEIPEKKTLHDKGETSKKNVPTLPTTSQKKADPPAKSAQKPDDPDKSTKKSAFIMRLKNIKIKRNPGSSKTNSEKSESSKTKEAKPVFSAASSPSRSFMQSPSRSFMASPSRSFKTSGPSESPISPSITKKTVTMSSSPSRAFHTSSFPSHSKEGLSPLNPSRLARQTSLR